MRKDEYKRHPLFLILDSYSEELKGFIARKHKRHEQMKEAAEKLSLGPGALYNPVTCTYMRSN